MNKLIASQQEILKELGLYQGKIDANWGVKSRSAMAGFQQTHGFAPAKPRSNNDFFSPFEPLPAGWVWADDGSCVSADPEFAKAMAEKAEAEQAEAEQRRLEKEKADAEKAEADELAAMEKAEIEECQKLTDVAMEELAKEIAPEEPIESEPAVEVKDATIVDINVDEKESEEGSTAANTTV